MTTLDVGSLEVSAFPEIPKGYDPPPGSDDVLCKPALPFIKPEIPALLPIPALYIPSMLTGFVATFPLSKTIGITFCVKNFIPVKFGRLNEGILSPKKSTNYPKVGKKSQKFVKNLILSRYAKKVP